jgi:hypothetical protein
MYLNIDKRDYFTFSIVNLPFICRNILAALSQLIRYSRACGSNRDCLDRGLLLMKKLRNQRFLIRFLTRPTRGVPLVKQELLTLLFVFTYVYWCPKRIPYHMLFVSFKLHDWCNLWSRNCFTLSNHMKLSSPLLGSVSLNLQIYVKCFVDHCLFVLLLLYCLSFCGFWLPLWYLLTVLNTTWCHYWSRNW